MKKKNGNSQLKTWSSLKKERFKKDPEEAYEYLRSSLEKNADRPQLIVNAIKSVSESLDISLERLAKKANIPVSTVYKALGKEGNPTIQTLAAILKALGMRLTIEKRGA